MIGLMRGKFANWVIGIVIGFIAFVFVFYGVYSPSNMGMRGGAAGSVNGETITMAEFNQIMNRYAEGMRARGFGEEQLKMLGVQNWAWEELVNQRLLVQQAKKLSLMPSEQAIRDQILKIPAFQKNGVFDNSQYKDLLSRNNMTPAQFERSIREEMVSNLVQDFFKTRALVTDEEIKRDFLIENDKRNVQFVLITTEAGKKLIQIKDAEVTAFFKDAKKTEQAKARFEAQKDFKYKDKKFEDVQNEIAKQILMEDKTVQVKETNELLADKIATLLDGSKKSETEITALLKPYGAKVEKTGFFSSKSTYVPNVGEAKDLVRDAFLSPSPIDKSKGGKAKKYVIARGVLVALVTEHEAPHLAKLTSGEKDVIRKRLTSAREGDLYSRWLKNAKASAKIKKNEKLFGGEGKGGGFEFPAMNADGQF